jgi:hypothetical protein
MVTLPIQEIWKLLKKQEKTGSPFCLPPQLTHLTQPLNASLIFSLITCYDAVVEKQATNLGLYPVTVMKVCLLGRICNAEHPTSI